jgi:hypothetical protein
MIVDPNKGVFFVATALMYAASLYGAESFSATDPMTRIFIGEANQLTVPPGFHEALANPPPKTDCAFQPDAAAIPSGQIVAEPPVQSCMPPKTEAPLPAEPAPIIGAATAKARVIRAQPASVASTAERP